MKMVEVNKSQYGHHHEYVYDSSEEDEVASLFDLDFHQRPPLKARRRIREETVQSLDLMRANSSQSDNLQVQCIECDEDPEVALQVNREPLLWDKQVQEPNVVLVAVEVRPQHIVGHPACRTMAHRFSTLLFTGMPYQSDGRGDPPWSVSRTYPVCIGQ
jgi:hypothetical protein